jgi:hypothetical protein
MTTTTTTSTAKTTWTKVRDGVFALGETGVTMRAIRDFFDKRRIGEFHVFPPKDFTDRAVRPKSFDHDLYNSLEECRAAAEQYGELVATLMEREHARKNPAPTPTLDAPFVFTADRDLAERFGTREEAYTVLRFLHRAPGIDEGGRYCRVEVVTIDVGGETKFLIVWRLNSERRYLRDEHRHNHLDTSLANGNFVIRRRLNELGEDLHPALV